VVGHRIRASRMDIAPIGGCSSTALNDSICQAHGEALAWSAAHERSIHPHPQLAPSIW
jgi:hypothetical protein